MTKAREDIQRALERERDQGEVIRVTSLLSRAEEIGATTTEIWDGVVGVCDDLSLQATWVDWEEVPEQNEIALRLRVLAEVRRVHEGLGAFLAFFFGASAPDLYRPAALALGRHSWELDSFRERLREYAGARNVDIETAISLNGERSRRRLLLAATGRFLNAPPEDLRPPLPVEIESGDDLHGAAVSDVSVLSICCARLLQAGYDEDRFVGMCWQIAERVHEYLERGGSQRSFVRAWGELLVALEEVDSSRSSSIWAASLKRFEERDERESSEFLASLWEFDAAVAAAATPSSDLLEGLEGGDIGDLFDDVDYRWLSRVRYWQWHRREYRTGPEASFFDESPPPGLDPVLHSFGFDVLRSVESGQRHTKAMHRWIASAIERLQSPTRWWAHPDESRAMLSFLLLDAVRYRQPPRTTVRRLLVTAGISGPKVASAGTGTEGVAGMPWSGYHDVLWRIFEREGAPPNFPVESEAFTSISTANRLLGFLRAGQAVRDLDILVDALEHFLRVEVASDSEFRLQTFLYRIAARKPHPSLFRELARRIRTRKLGEAPGHGTNFTEALEFFATARRGRFDVGALPESVHEWFPELGSVDRALLEVESRDDLYRAILDFADQIDPRSSDPETRQRGIVDILGQIATEEGVVLLDSSVSETQVEFETLASSVAESIRTIRTSADALFVERESNLAEMHREARTIVAELRAVCESLVPCVSTHHAAVLERVTERLGARIEDWMGVMTDGLEARVDEEITEPGGVEEARSTFARLAAVLPRVDSGALRARALRIGFAQFDRGRDTESRDELVSEYADEPEAWNRDKERLAAAADETAGLAVDETWSAFLVDRWERLADTAMDLQVESWVLELVERPEFAALRDEGRNTATMDRLEQWLMDRYHLPTVASLFEERREGPGRFVSAHLSAVVGMIGNFTHVWLALLVGAVMLLDFGDAWVELARQGDVVGIAATFAIGAGGTYLYLLADIARKTHSPVSDASGRRRTSPYLRATFFLVVCAGYAALVTSGLWYMFSGTEIVLQGDGALLHVLVWTGFALFVGIFFGLLTDAG